MPEQAKKARALVKDEFCNCDSGNCLMLDDGEYHKCTQLSSNMLMCSWFKEAVLPLNKVLEAKITNNHKDDEEKTHILHCDLCGKSFVPRSNSVKYCDSCAIKERKKRQAEFAKKEINYTADA